MKRCFSFFFASMALLLVCGAANAAILPGGNLELEDSDYESQVVDVNQNGRLDDGDMLLTILQVLTVDRINGTINTLLDNSVTQSNVATYTTSTSAITAISLIKVASGGVSLLETVTADGVGGGNDISATYTFVAPTAAEWLAATGLAAVNAGTTAVAFDDPASAPNDHIEPGLSPLSAAIATAINGTRLWELGLVGPDTFWTATAVDTVGAVFDATNPLAITGLTFYAALNVTDANGAGDLALHNMLADPDLNVTNFGLFTGPTALQLQGNNQPGSPGSFQLRTDTNLYVSVPVPEPASLACWAALSVLGLAASRSRQPKKS